MLASILRHDIIIVNPIVLYRLPGGEIGSGESAGGQPIYVAYYEERKFSAGHYQAIEPLPDTNVTAFPELGRFILNLIHRFIHLYIFSTSRQSSIKNGFVPTRSKLDSCYELGSEEEEECQSRCQFRCKKKEYFIIIRDLSSKTSGSSGADAST